MTKHASITELTLNHDNYKKGSVIEDGQDMVNDSASKAHRIFNMATPPSMSGEIPRYFAQGHNWPLPTEPAGLRKKKGRNS